MKSEIWKDIPGYDGLYSINTRGDVLSLRSGMLRKNTRSGKGYRKISLSGHDHIKKQYLVHRLVADVFLTKPSEHTIEVNHKNLDKTDNRVENLEWVTPAENMSHAYANGRTDFRRSKRSDNRSGFAGVSAHDGGYQATIGYRGVVYYLGWYKSKKVAVAARKRAEARFVNEI